MKDRNVDISNVMHSRDVILLNLERALFDHAHHIVLFLTITTKVDIDYYWLESH